MKEKNNVIVLKLMTVSFSKGKGEGSFEILNEEFIFVIALFNSTKECANFTKEYA